MTPRCVVTVQQPWKGENEPVENRDVFTSFWGVWRVTLYFVFIQTLLIRSLEFQSATIRMLPWTHSFGPCKFLSKEWMQWCVFQSATKTCCHENSWHQIVFGNLQFYFLGEPACSFCSSPNNLCRRRSLSFCCGECEMILGSFTQTSNLIYPE